MATRKPVSVFPEPVGEATSTSSPLAMWGQAAVCGGVGPSGKRRANQLATAGGKSDSGEASGIVLFHPDAVTLATPLRSERALAPPAGDHGWLSEAEPARRHVVDVFGDLSLGGDAVVE